MVKLLVEYGANVTAKDKVRETNSVFLALDLLQTYLLQCYFSIKVCVYACVARLGYTVYAYGACMQFRKVCLVRALPDISGIFSSCSFH